jgi:hypothetical protein
MDSEYIRILLPCPSETRALRQGPDHDRYYLRSHKQSLGHGGLAYRALKSVS